MGLGHGVSNERTVEIPWAVREAVAPVLDVGCAESIYLDQLPQPLQGIDVRPCRSRALHDHLIGDIRTIENIGPYQTVLAISTLEHIGLECRAYGTESDEEEGDRSSLLACHSLVKLGGQLLVSVPFGANRDYGWFRQYDVARLEKLLDGLDYSYLVYSKGNPWFLIEPELAEDFEYHHELCSAAAVALITVRK